MIKAVEDKIDAINKKYFSKEKDEVNIMNDLSNCAKRIIYVLTIGEIMRIAERSYEPNKIISDRTSSLNGKISGQTIFSYSDPYNFTTLYYIYAMSVDSMMLELRKFFYCRKGANSAGTFVNELANLKNIRRHNEFHKSQYGLFGHTTGFIYKKDIKRGYMVFNGNRIGLKDYPLDDNFFINNDTECFTLYYDVCSNKAVHLAKEFYNQNYFNEDNRRISNIADIKEYERYYFHKDEWVNNKRWQIHTEVERVQGFPFNRDIYTDLCKTNIDNIFKQLEKLVRIMNLYYKSCVCRFWIRNMNIYCDIYGSLPKMVLDICDSFSIEKPKGLHNQIASMIYKKIPHTIDAMMLTK